MTRSMTEILEVSVFLIHEKVASCSSINIEISFSLLAELSRHMSASAASRAEAGQALASAGHGAVSLCTVWHAGAVSAWRHSLERLNCLRV